MCKYCDLKNIGRYEDEIQKINIYFLKGEDICFLYTENCFIFATTFGMKINYIPNLSCLNI